MDNRSLIGRAAESRRLRDLMRERRNILVVGAEGVGKSALINQTLVDGNLKHYLHSTHSATLKEALENLVRMAVGGKESARQNILTLKKTCYRLLDNGPEYACFDHVGPVDRRYYAFLSYLRERGLPLFIATRGVGKENLGRLWMGVYDFATIEVKNLDAASAGQLTDRWASALDLAAGAAVDFKKEVFKASNGNPSIIIELCRLARNHKYRINGTINVRLINLDRRIQKAVR
jgi:hypothetical protein